MRTRDGGAIVARVLTADVREIVQNIAQGGELAWTVQIWFILASSVDGA
jgi:hypothetical protein